MPFDGDAKQGFSELDIQFARLAERIAGAESPEVALAAALASRARVEGHICLDLADAAGLVAPAQDGDSRRFPTLERWLDRLGKSPAVGRPGDWRPLVLDGTRLYLYRYWDYERRLAEGLRSRAADDPGGIDDALLREGLGRLFPPGGDGTDWQKAAAFTAVTKRLCVLSGGPGTGKTYTVAKILALLIEQAGGSDCRIALAAPTGKAAARLQESIRGVARTLPCTDSVRSRLPEEAATVHRLLGSVPGTSLFRHDAAHPLAADAVVIDEASMVDLALFSQLVQALPARTRLILLGDRDQLASVEAGAVLGDICDTGREHGYTRRHRERYGELTGEKLPPADPREEDKAMGDCIVGLRKSWRFGEDSGIRTASLAVNAGEGRRALDEARSGHFADLHWLDLPRPEALQRFLEEHLGEWPGDFRDNAAPESSLNLLDRFRILCALREGPYGVSAVNGLVERILRRRGIIQPEGRWYAGRPVMITRNDYTIRLFNGDVGMILPDREAGGELRAFFRSPDGSLRSLPPSRLPEHETVWAMTVHKSQGSEFDRVLLVLPDRDAPILTRELLYTAVTRARKRIAICGRQDVFTAACSRRTARFSGLRDALWGPRL
ncbi:MAG TPA: exodeoxyribonuclease V subunit alpha [Syntrophales bacterium]|nr:exodeoxyribonuclease V subunit alpha [Syntrophales bacterium]